jgi:surfactin synthase thioesterase subunit
MLPFAGGSVRHYENWINYMSRGIKIDLIELPGRGSRKNEAYYTSYNHAVEDLSKIISKKIETENYHIFGHSMGALLAFSISLNYQNNKFPTPKTIFISGRTSFQYRFFDEIESISDDSLLKRLSNLGLKTVEIYKNKRVGKYFMKKLREDYKIINSYEIPSDVLELPNGVIIYGNNDPFCNDIKSWDYFFKKTIDYHKIEGSHWGHDKDDKIIEILNQYMQTTLARDSI